MDDLFASLEEVIRSTVPHHGQQHALLLQLDALKKMLREFQRVH
ncbi:hypothetical protein [Pseudooceanicola sp. HF7]|nr:hypothetical protein [Pseudooceanicola sp. HF7]